MPTHSPAEFAEILPRLRCDVAQPEVWTVGLFVHVVMTFTEVFLHVTLVRSILDVSPAKESNHYHSSLESVFVLVLAT